MGKILKYLLFAVLVGLWLYLVGSYCNKPKNVVESTTSSMGLTDATQEEAVVNEDNLEDLYEVEPSDVKDGNADNSNAEGNTNLEATATDSYGEAANDLVEVPAEETANEEAATSSNNETSNDTYSGNTSGSTIGKYLVVTGSYLSEANGRVMAKKLRRMGYEGAEVLSFDLSQYYSVTAGRYNDLGEARAAAKRIKSKGIEAYVHKRRGKKVGN